MPDKDHFIAPDGERITLWRWPHKPGRPTLHWAHATGFGAQTYTPLLDPLSRHVNVIAWDMRGHGDTATPEQLHSLRNWHTYYDDMTRLVDMQDGPIWLAGHSVGGMVSYATAGRRADKVAGLLLTDPVMLAGKEGLIVGFAKTFRFSHKVRLAAGASRRRSRFESREKAYENFRGKRAFASWPDAWLRAYVEDCLIDDGEGGVRLACDPAYEARSFSLAETRPFARTGDLKRVDPIGVLVAENGSTFRPAAHRLIARKLPHARVQVVANSSHFLPMEHTDFVRDWILDAMGLAEHPAGQAVGTGDLHAD